MPNTSINRRLKQLYITPDTLYNGLEKFTTFMYGPANGLIYDNNATHTQIIDSMYSYFINNPPTNEQEIAQKQEIEIMSRIMRGFDGYKTYLFGRVGIASAYLIRRFERVTDKASMNIIIRIIMRSVWMNYIKVV